MREISLHLPKADYSPGERVEGYAIIACDEDFDCESVNLVFSCKEQSRVVVGSGKHRRVYLEEHQYFEQYIELLNQSSVLEGETRFEFAFEIPEGSVSSFEGVYSWIRYEIRGKIEVKWALDPKTESSIIVAAPSQHSVILEQMMIQEEHAEDGIHLLRVEAESDTIRRGEDFRFRFLIGTEANIRGVRTDLYWREHVAPKGRETDYDNEIDQQYWEEYMIPRENWIEVTVRTDDSWLEPFKTELIECMYILKVTLDIPWRFDKSIETPLKFSSDIKEDEFSTSIFDF
ncbi:MAG: hypothetical protein ACXADC_09485 [Candidatus Thorarchaeota archaeon]